MASLSSIGSSGLQAAQLRLDASANNVANAMGTSVGSGALTVRRALILAAVMEFAGAYLAGRVAEVEYAQWTWR